MTQRIFRIATRKSPLALWQANHIKHELEKKHPEILVELLPMLTSGDRFLKDTLQRQGGKGLFVKELEEALLDKRADFAVHSTKDVPVTFPEGLTLAAICSRDNPMDALLSIKYDALDKLPAGAVVGTASLRRQSQLLVHRPDLTIKTLRGNVNTRIEKLHAGAYDAIILAAAGLERMGFTDHIKHVLSEHTMLPACGQGALSIECRIDDTEVLNLISGLNDTVTAACVHAERRVNARLGGNCHVPLAVYCKPELDDQIRLRAKVLSSDGRRCIEAEKTGAMENALTMADAVSTLLLAQGAEALLSGSSHD